MSRVEGHLERLLAAGWRNADADLARLRADLPLLERLGLIELATQARGVIDALPVERLPAIALALAAIRLLQARVLDDTLPPGNWEPAVGRRAVGAERIVPLARVAVGDGEAWACVRLHGFASDWILLDPVPTEEANAPTIWLFRALRARLAWCARFPLGSGGDVQLATAAEIAWLPVTERADDPFGPFREAAAAGNVKDSQPLHPTVGKLRLARLERDDGPACVWPDARTQQAFLDFPAFPVLAIAWADGAAVAPLAIVIPGDGARPARLVHLVEGHPTDPLVGGPELEEP